MDRHRRPCIMIGIGWRAITLAQAVNTRLGLRRPPLLRRIGARREARQALAAAARQRHIPQVIEAGGLVAMRVSGRPHLSGLADYRRHGFKLSTLAQGALIQIKA
jgi:hypothetical protein